MPPPINTTNVTITMRMDPLTRDMARALCHEYDMSVSQVLKQLVRAQYHAIFPGQTPQSVPLRPLDHAARQLLRGEAVK